MLRLRDAFTREATTRLGGDAEAVKFAIGPVIIALVPVVVDLIQECSANDPERAVRLARNPGLLRRWRLRSEIEKVVPGNDKDSRELREELFEAAIAAGKAATVADFATVGEAA